MMILTMLEEGKISSDEASKLIEALDDSEFKETISSNIKKSNDEKEKKLNTKEVSTEQKIEEKTENLGESIENNTNSIADKIVNAVDNFLEKGNFMNLFGGYETVVENLEKTLPSDFNKTLEFNGINGRIILKPWDKNELYVKATSNIKKNIYDGKSQIYEIIEDDNKIIFKPRYTSGIGIKLEVSIPDNKYQKIILSTTNGKIDVSDIKSKEILCNTSNASINISDFYGDNLIANTKNGKVGLYSIKSEKIQIRTSNASALLENIVSKDIDSTTKNGKSTLIKVISNSIVTTTSNSSINLDNVEASSIIAKTSNGKVYTYDLKTENLNHIDLRTSNSSIDLSSKSFNKPICINAKTSMGRMDINVPKLVYDVNNQNQLGSKTILAHSIDYTKDNGIEIILTTSNGSIRIN